jgi:hypothetical protein
MDAITDEMLAKIILEVTKEIEKDRADQEAQEEKTVSLPLNPIPAF